MKCTSGPSTAKTLAIAAVIKTANNKNDTSSFKVDKEEVIMLRYELLVGK